MSECQPLHRPAQLPLVLPLELRIRRIPTFDRLALAAVRVYGREGLGVENLNLARDALEPRCDGCDISRARLVRVGLKENATPGEHIPIRLCGRLRATRTRYRD
jgi:hypothetical protein